MARVLESLASSAKAMHADDSTLNDDKVLKKVLGRLNIGRGDTARRDDTALSRILESLTPPGLTSRRDDMALNRIFHSGTARLPIVLPSLVTEVADMLLGSFRPVIAEVVAGGHGRGNRLDQLCRPMGITVDHDGAVLIADCENCRIVRWARAAMHGEVLIGRNKGHSFQPLDVVKDGAGSLLIASWGGLEYWGAESAPEGAVIAEGALPSSILLDPDGSVIFSDMLEHSVTRCSFRGGRANRDVIAGAALQQATSGLAVVAGDSLSQLHRPFGIAQDYDGALLIADSGNHRILRWAPGAKQGEVVAGGNGRGSRLDQLSYPRAVVIESPDSILIADTFNDRVVRWRRGGSCGEVVAGGRGRGSRPEQLSRPSALALRRTGSSSSSFWPELFISDSGNHRVLRLPLHPPLPVDISFCQSAGGQRLRSPLPSSGKISRTQSAARHKLRGWR